MEKIGKRDIFLIVIIAAVAILSLLFLRDFTPKNELKYIDIAKTMAKNGQYFTLYDSGIPYTDKPPFFFWIINSIKYIFGTYNLGIIGSVVSFFPAVLILIMTYVFSKSYFGGKYNLIAPLILLTTPLFFIAASCIRMDIMMSFFITGSLVIFFLIYDNKIELCRKNSYMIYIFMGFGIYVKGMAGILVPFITILIFLILEKNITFLKKIYIMEGLTILLIMILGWFIPAVYFNGMGYINDLIVKQTIGRSLNAFTHKRPFYYYLTLLPVLYFQYIIPIVGIGIGYFKSKRELKKYEKFMLVWFISTILFFSIVSSKLWLYILPVVFPGAILISGYIRDLIEADKKELRRSIYLLNVILFIIGTGILFVYNIEVSGILLKDFIFTAFTYITMSILSVFLYKKNRVVSFVITFILSFLILILNLIFIVPKYNGIIGLKEISQSIERYNQKDVIVSYDFSDGIYAEYYLNKDIYSTSNKEEVDKLLNEKGKVILITRTKKISRIDIIWKYKLIYKNSQYCAVEIIGEK